MFLRAELPCREGQISLELGTKISFRYIEKRTGARKQVHITPSPDSNHYFAIFDEDDVDFEIVTDNRTSVDRDCGFDLKIYGNSYAFIQERNSRGLLKGVETNGRKFHFVKQSGPDGQALISTAASEHGISYERAALMVSQMKFTVQYSRPHLSPDQDRNRERERDRDRDQDHAKDQDQHMAIHVRSLSDRNRILTLGVSGEETVESVKMKIKRKEGTCVDEMRLIHGGKQLEDVKKIKDYGISANDVVYLVLRLTGGGWKNQHHEHHSNSYVRGEGGICAEDCENHDTLRQHLDPGHKVYGSERGVICFGENSEQFLRQARFLPDRSVHVEPFVIEMRMASRYKLLEYSPSGPRVTFAKTED